MKMVDTCQKGNRMAATGI